MVMRAKGEAVTQIGVEPPDTRSQITLLVADETTIST
jgi:hypothetical protein